MNTAKLCGLAALFLFYSGSVAAGDTEPDDKGKTNEGYINIRITTSSCSHVWFGDENHQVQVQPSGGSYLLGSNTSTVYTCETDGHGYLLANELRIHNYYTGAGTISNNKLTDNVNGVLLHGGGTTHVQDYSPPRNLTPTTLGFDYQLWAEAYWVLGSGGTYAKMWIKFRQGRTQ